MSFTWADGAITQATSAVATVSVTLSAAISAGDLIVCATGAPSFAIGDVSDTAGNTWQQIGSTAGFVSMFACLSAKAAAGGTVITVAHSGSSGTRFLVADRFTPSGTVTAGSSSSSTTGGSSGNCGSIAGDPGGNLLYAGIHTDQSNLTWTAGSSNGVSATTQEHAGNGSGSGFSEYVLSTAAGTQSMSWSASGSTGGQGALQATFSAAAPAGSAQVSTAPPQPASKPFRGRPQVITGVLANAFSADAGHGSAAVTSIAVSAADSGHGAGAAGSLNTGAVVAAARAVPQPAKKPPPAQLPQVITGTLADAFSADTGHGAGGVASITVIPAAQASGHGAGAVAHIALNSADSAAGAAGVPVIRPQAAGTADSGSGSAQGAVRPEAAGTTAVQAPLRPFTPARIPPQVITGPSSTRVITSADYGRGIGSDFFFISSADSAVGAGHGVILVSSADAGHGAGTSLSRWLSSADAGTGHGASLSRWPSSAGTGHGAGRALSAWPSSADSGHGTGAVTRTAVDAAATGHGTDAYGDLAIWTLLPPSWSERRGLVWITARLEDGSELELVRGERPTRELLELARMVSSGPVRHVKAADCGHGSGAEVAGGPASVTVWVTEAAQVAVWTESG